MMKFFLFTILALWAETVLCKGKSGTMDDLWKTFKTCYEKQYEKKEEEKRRKIWESKAEANSCHNLRADLGMARFTRGINAFSDLTPEEFMERKTGYIMEHGPWNAPKSNNSSRGRSLGSSRAPSQVDWRREGMVTPVMDQENCAACWAVVTTGCLEGQISKKTGKLVALSIQNLIDCAPTNGGKCDGGWMIEAYKYVAKKGIESEEDYPYEGGEGQCRHEKSKVIAYCDNYIKVPEGDENALKKAVGSYGPVAAGINASPDSFQNYKSGIYDDQSCSSDDINHAVLVVGYGTEDGVDYWILRNSWGESWGMKGYMNLLRNENNLCGLATRASYPTMNGRYN